MVYGIDPIRYLNTNEEMRAIIDLALNRAVEISDQRDQNLAVRIINQLAKAMKK